MADTYHREQVLASYDMRTWTLDILDVITLRLIFCYAQYLKIHMSLQRSCYQADKGLISL